MGSTREARRAGMSDASKAVNMTLAGATIRINNALNHESE
jgi:hypothetical protein